MKNFCSSLRVLMLVVVMAPASSRAQAHSEWPDNLVDHLIGAWKLGGPIMGREAHHDVEASWVLNHQFVSLHEKTEAGAPESEKEYEAIWFLGYDPVSERYVMHLLDIFGGRFSETLGYGTREGTAIHFVFEYPDGPFHTTFQWSPEKDTWEWVMTRKDKEGKWSSFGDLKLTRAAK